MLPLHLLPYDSVFTMQAINMHHDDDENDDDDDDDHHHLITNHHLLSKQTALF